MPALGRFLTWRVLTVITILCLGLISPSLAFAANDSAEGAITLSAGANTAAQSITGSPGGAYQYYRFRYQGGSAPVLVSLSFSPGYGNTGRDAFGFNLYEPGGVSFAGVPTSNDGNTSTAQFTLSHPSAVDVLVQVYNYTNGLPVSYTLTISGLSGGSAETLVAQNNTTPEHPLAVNTINASLGGTLTGSAAGAFHYFTLRYPGGDSPLTVTLNASPAYNGQGQAYGFNLYRANPSGATALVASGALLAQDSHSATYSATITNRSAATYQLQVVNYWPEVSVTYGVTVTGLAGEATAASGNSDASHAIVLNSARQGATESLTGGSGGAFNYFLVNYPGQQSRLAISVTYSSLAGISPDAVGFNVYNGSALEATVRPVDDGTGTQSAVWIYQNDAPATFGIQVFNYAGGTNLSYTIYQIGSQ